MFIRLFALNLFLYLLWRTNGADEDAAAESHVLSHVDASPELGQPEHVASVHDGSHLSPFWEKTREDDGEDARGPRCILSYNHTHSTGTFLSVEMRTTIKFAEGSRSLDATCVGGTAIEPFCVGHAGGDRTSLFPLPTEVSIEPIENYFRFSGYRIRFNRKTLRRTAPDTTVDVHRHDAGLGRVLVEVHENGRVKVGEGSCPASFFSATE